MVLRTVGAPSILLVAVLFGCTAAAPQAGITAQPWPEADSLFHQDPRWLGADGAFSIDLGGGRVLWLFGDTFVATSPAHTRSESAMPRNTVAIQTGYDPSQAAIAFYWAMSAGTPASFFAGTGSDWYWPGHGAIVEGRLIVFLSRVTASTGGLGFQGAGWTAVRIDDPGDPPSMWNPVGLTVPSSTLGVTFGETALVESGYLYVYGTEDQSRAVHLIRWPASYVARGDLTSPEWWTPSGWVAQSTLTSRPHALVADGSTELRVQPDPRGSGWLEVQAVGFGAATLALRTAPDFAGPWGPLALFYTPPESTRAGVLVYAGKSHPELLGSQIVATYASNSTSFSALVSDTSLYYPRFVRAKWR